MFQFFSELKTEHERNIVALAIVQLAGEATVIDQSGTKLRMGLSASGLRFYERLMKHECDCFFEVVDSEVTCFTAYEVKRAFWNVFAATVVPGPRTGELAAGMANFMLQEARKRDLGIVEYGGKFFISAAGLKRLGEHGPRKNAFRSLKQVPREGRN